MKLKRLIRPASVCLVLIEMSAFGQGALDDWSDRMQRSRPEVPPSRKAYLERSAKALPKANVDAFAEDRAIAEASLPFPLPDDACWTRLETPEAEYLSECVFSSPDGFACRFAVYGQYGCKRAYYWTGVRAGTSADGTALTYDQGTNFVATALSRKGSPVDIRGIREVLVSAETEIAVRGVAVDCPFDRFRFILADDRPGANWAHPCRFVFIAEDGCSFAVSYESWKPKIRRKPDGARLWLLPGFFTERSVSMDEVKNSAYSSVPNGTAPGLAYYAGDVSHSYFVLICGGASPEDNGIRFWADTAQMYSTLTKKYGVAANHIHVLMSDGLNPGQDACLGEKSTGEPVLVSSPTDLDGDGTVDVDGPATWLKVNEVFNSLESTLTSQDQLFVFVTSHGFSVGTAGASNYRCGANLYSPNDDGRDIDGYYSNFYDENLQDMTKNIACPIAFAFETCFSGGFIDDLTATAQRMVATACNHYEYSWGTYEYVTGPWTGAGIGKTTSHNHWARPFISALRGCLAPTSSNYPWTDGTACVDAVDANGDGRASFAEAANYAKVKDPKTCTRSTHSSALCSNYEHPQYGESSSGLGASFWLLKQNATPVSRPANDNFANATAISGTSGSLTASSANATKEIGEPFHGISSATNSVWWKWTASVAGSMTITTEGSGFDTGLGVYTGSSVSALTKITDNDDNGAGGLWSSVTFAAVAGTTYYIAVAGYNGATGSVKLNWSFSGTPSMYSIMYLLGGGTHGATHPTSATYDTAFYVSAPTRSGYTFAGWTVTSGLNTSTAKWGTTSNPSAAISSSSTKCVNGATGNVYFKNLTATANGSVTLTANWEALQKPVIAEVRGTPNYVSLSWDAVEEAARYEIFRSTDAEDFPATPLVRVPPKVLTYMDRTCSPGVRYFYWVAAVVHGGMGVSDSVVTHRAANFQTLSPSALSFDGTGGVARVTVNANVDWQASVAEPWLTLDASGTESNGTLTVTASANASGTTRRATITLTAAPCADYPASRTLAVSQLDSAHEPRTLYVAADGSDTGRTGTDSSQPLATITKALSLAVAGDTIIVGDGCYSPFNAYQKPVTIRSVNGPEKTVIEGNGTATCAYLNGAENPATLIGFTLMNGYNAASGGGVSGGIVRNCILTGNHALYAGGGAYNSTLYNCLLVNNSTVNTGGGGARSCTLYNCTIVGNSGKTGGGTHGCTLYNCIVWGNTATSSPAVYDSTCTSTCTETGNPGFVNAATGDYRLASGSICIDAGDNGYVEAGETDLDGNPRVVGGVVDQGAYEWQGGSGTPTTYSIAYALGGGTHGTTHPASAIYGTAFYVSAPTRSGYTFAGWTVTSGLNTSTAKWGTSSNPSTAISSSSTKCANGATGNVYFKNLTPTANGSVTLTANWTAIIPTPEPFQESSDGAYALFVGINQYTLSGCSTLPCCIKDVEAMHGDCVLYGGWSEANCRELTDGLATKSNVRYMLASLAEVAEEGDTVLFYQSSHGGSIGSTADAFLCMHDAEYWDYELAEDLMRFGRGVKVLIVVDACRSAGLFKNGGETARPFDLAARVMKIMQSEMNAVANASIRIRPEDIGWITAADYNQNSVGGSNGSLFTLAMTDAWEDDEGTADLDGDRRLDFYELFKAAEMVGANRNPPIIGQCENEPVLKSVTARLYSGFAPPVIIGRSGEADVEIPGAWFTTGTIGGRVCFNPGKFAALFGTDYAIAAKKPTGKVDAHGNPMYVWQDFIAGTDPTDKTSEFKASISFEDGKPVITWTPDLNEGGTRSIRTYRTLGINDLSQSADPAAWREVTPGNESAYRFFKVEVELK